MFDDILKEKLWEFSIPYYKGKDIMHDITHIERVFREADKLASKYPQANRDIVFAACCLHGFVFNTEEVVRAFLKELNLHEEQAKKIIIAAFESQVSSVPETLEGKIV